MNCDEFAELVYGLKEARVRVRPFYAGFGGDEGKMQATWERHRDVILEWWITGTFSTRETCSFVERMPPWVFVCGSAGARPWAWWKFDAPEDAPEECLAEYLLANDLLVPGEKEALNAR